MVSSLQLFDSPIFDSPIALVTALSFLVISIVFAYTLACWRQRNMMYFAVLAFAVFINVLGYFLEVTATTLEAAVVASKVAYIGVPLTGILFYYFSRVFSGKPRLKALPFTLLLLPAPIFTISVFAYPWLPVFYEELAFSTQGLVNHLMVTPGLLYYPCVLYNLFFTALALFNLVTSFMKQKRYEGAVIFIFAITIPLAAYFYNLAFGNLDGWNPQRSALTLSMALLAIYLVRYKKAEWLSVGRELVVQDMDDAFILLDNKGNIIDHNVSAENYFPKLQKGALNYKLEELWEFPEENYKKYDVYQFGITQNGQYKQLKVSISPLEANEKATGTLVVISDDTASYQMIQDLTRMARTDELTGLRNRATFFSEGSLSYAMTNRHEGHKGCALMMDIDHFKVVNDTYGHAMGDEVLAYIGELILSRFRHTDISGRYGGEELCVWMPATVHHGAYHVAEEIQAAVEAKQFVYGSTTFSVTVSIGIACMRESNPKDFDDLIRQADEALYEAKNTGRNRICTYKPKAE
ncbi:MAG: diguanylate cyclase [Coriobacteriia bacterium]|nr:diguanylate cyclase [Coriobacteriia bacterium]